MVFLRGAIPKGFMFPVFAAMLKNRELYDGSLEVFSGSLMRLVEYELDDFGQMTVPGETDPWCRHINMTAQAEALSEFVRLTAERGLLGDLDLLASYDETRQTIREVVDMPDRLLDLFIRLCLQNNGHLSMTKRKSHFGFLSDGELADMKKVVKESYARD